MAWLGKAAADYAKGDMSGGLTLVAGLAKVLEGITAEAFDADVLEFLTQAQDARSKQPYKLLTYRPMVELVHYLQNNDFRVYITSGGGRFRRRHSHAQVCPRSQRVGTRAVGTSRRCCAREYAYDDGTNKTLQRAAHEGWTVVSMKNDWKSMFGD